MFEFGSSSKLQGKVLAIEYAEVTDFEPFGRVVSATGRLVAGLALRSGKSWQKLPLSKSLGQYEISTTKNAQGDLVSVKVSGASPASTAQALTTAQRLQTADLVVRIRVTDSLWLIADPDYFASFSYALDGANVRRLKFSIESKLPYSIVSL